MRSISRRELLKLVGLGTAGSILAACAPQTPAPQAAQPAEVTRQVEVTRIVEGTPVVEVITTTPQPTTPPAAAAPAKHVTLKVWDQFTGDPGKTVFDKIYSNFMAKHTNITIKREVSGTGDLDQTARTALASGAGPDVIYLDVSPAQDLIDAGLIAALDSYSQQYAWPELFTAQGLKYTSYKGKLWGLGGESEFVGTWVNKTIFEKEGWTIPTKVSEMIDWAPKAIAKGYKVPFSNWIGNYGGTFGWMTNPVQNYLGVQFFEDLLFNQKGTWEDPEMAKGLDIMYTDLRKAGLWGKEPITDYSAAVDLLYQKKAPFMHMGTWELPNADAFAKKNNVDVGYMPFIDFENGHPPVFTQGMGSAWYISKAAKAPDEAALLLNFLFADLEVRRMYIEEGGYFPPTKYDTGLYNLSPLKKMAADELQKENSMGWNLDVLLPHSWAVTNFDAATAIWLGKETIPQLLTSLQKVYTEDYLPKFNK